MRATQTKTASAALAALALASWAGAPQAQATEFSEIGRGFNPDIDSVAEVDGFFRLRGDSMYNLDLDHGLTPSGRPLYPVPIADPDAQTLRHTDMRLRTDVSLYAPLGGVRVNTRVDVIDNLPLGSTPRGTPVTTTSQQPPTDRVFRIKRAWGEALTPFGVLAAGRMGNTWGLGMLSNGGDCLDCDSGDAADRVAFVTTQLDHFVAVAYDFGWTGPTVARPVDTRLVDLEPSDNVSTITAALLRQRDEYGLKRRLDAGEPTFDYGLVFSHRWQDKDIPISYVPTTDPVELSPQQVIDRNYRAQAWDVWLRLVGPGFRIEAEAAILRARIEEASLLPGVRYDVPLTSTQYAAALESDFGPQGGRFDAGLDVGLASGDAAYGFGAYPGPAAGPAEPGDLEGSQANPPYDNQVNNFRFHPDYRVDQILFREIIGTVTDAVYVRPHLGWDIWEATPGLLRFDLAGVFSAAAQPSSTPSGEAPLGVEIDPTLSYISRDGFGVRLDYGVLFPLAGFDNVAAQRSARPAQLWRLRLSYGF